MWRVWLPLLILTIILPPVVLAFPLVERHLIDNVLLTRDGDRLPETIALYAGVWLLSSVIAMTNEVLRTYFRERVLVRFRQRLFRQCESLSLAFARREHSGRTMSLFVSDAPSMSGLVSTTIFVLLGNFFGLLFGSLLMFALNWKLALAVFVATPLLGGLAVLITRPLRPASRRAQEKAAEVNEQLHENLSGMREVVAFGQQGAQERRFGTSLRELLRLRMRVTYIDTIVGTGQTMFYLAATLIIVGYGGYLFIEGQITLGTLIAMRSFLNLILDPASQMLGLVGNIQKSLAAADRIYGFLDLEPDVPDSTGARMPSTVTGRITFDRVGFAYQEGKPVLHDASFTANPGELVALVGPSGAGKSTLVSLIARFYDPDDGVILLDDIDLWDLPLDGLRANIGMVFQDTFLFATTVRDNIAFGRPEASDDEIISAAQAANAWEFITRLPDGLDTLVGERGVRFSEGQKQRLAIARTILRDPRILILDEPTSALDARSEHLLQEALNTLMRDRTTFVIAHRLSTVQRADRILVLDAGRIVEQGTHAELLRLGGLYRELHDLQFVRAGNESVEITSIVPAEAVRAV